MQAKDFNRPDSGCSITNSRGLRLHFRVDWDNFTAAKMVLFYVHGFGGHCNRVEARTMARTFNSGGAAVVLMDQMGHGYSEGERALLLSHEDLVEDLVQLIAALMAPGTVEAGREATLSTEVSGSPNLGKLSTLPFFVMGGSMGGAVSLLTAHALRTDERYRDLGVPVCRGAVLMAPALSFKLPHWAVVETMRWEHCPCGAVFAFKRTECIVQRRYCCVYRIALTPHTQIHTHTHTHTHRYTQIQMSNANVFLRGMHAYWRGLAFAYFLAHEYIIYGWDSSSIHYLPMTTYAALSILWEILDPYFVIDTPALNPLKATWVQSLWLALGMSGKGGYSWTYYGVTLFATAVFGIWSRAYHSPLLMRWPQLLGWTTFLVFVTLKLPVETALPRLVRRNRALWQRHQQQTSSSTPPSSPTWPFSLSAVLGGIAYCVLDVPFLELPPAPVTKEGPGGQRQGLGAGSLTYAYSLFAASPARGIVASAHHGSAAYDPRGHRHRHRTGYMGAD